MKYLVMIMLAFAVQKVKGQPDSIIQNRMDFGNTIQCVKIDFNSIACYTNDVDENNDGFIDADEWNNADYGSKGVIELDEAYNEQDVFDPDGDYRYDGILNEDDIYEPGTGGDYDYPDYDLFDDEEDGAFQ